MCLPERSFGRRAKGRVCHRPGRCRKSQVSAGLRGSRSARPPARPPPGPVARLPVHPEVAGAAGAGDQGVRRRRRRRERPRRGPAATGRGRGRTGRGRSSAARSPRHRRPRRGGPDGADQPAGRPTRPGLPLLEALEDVGHRLDEAGIVSASLAWASATQHARCRVHNSPASARVASRSSSSSAPQPPIGTRARGWARSGRRSAVRRTDCSWRHRAIGWWRRTAPPARTSWPRPLRGLGVDGVLQQAVLVGLLGERGRVAHEARQQPHDGLGDGQRGHLAPVEHVVADGDLQHLRAVPGLSSTRWSMPS